MAIESERVTADVIEANEFLELSAAFAVSGVPKIVLNDRVELLGSQRESRFLQAVLEAVKKSDENS
jgi:predicted DsbA family dithiol-disulfide isomerase